MEDLHPELTMAIAEIAYATAKSDGQLQDTEKDAFYQIIKEELGEKALNDAMERFNLLDEEFDAEMIQAYRGALSRLKRHRRHLNDDIKNKFLDVIKKVANSYEGMEAAESIFIRKFKKDLKSL